MLLFLKAVITAIIVVAVSVISKKSSLIGGILASLPLTSILIFMWMYAENKNVSEIIDLSKIILLMIVPSLLFFIFLIFFLRKEMNFYAAISLSSALMFGSYSIYTYVLSKFGVQL
ncbi:MAG: DUF3147 family protein [Bacteriovorax sp.]